LRLLAEDEEEDPTPHDEILWEKGEAGESAEEGEHEDDEGDPEREEVAEEAEGAWPGNDEGLFGWCRGGEHDDEDCLRRPRSEEAFFFFPLPGSSSRCRRRPSSSSSSSGGRPPPPALPLRRLKLELPARFSMAASRDSPRFSREQQRRRQQVGGRGRGFFLVPAA
jgi:hypothetical protein